MISVAVLYPNKAGSKFDLDYYVHRRGCHVNLAPARTRVEGLGSCSGRSRRPPILKPFASESAERVAGNEMALDVERVLDCGMNGQEPLC